MKFQSRLSPNSAQQSPKCVLVVDSQAMIRTVLTSLLQSWGYRGHPADGLIAACRAVVSEGPFDAVICNAELPDGTAFDLIRWMRGHDLHVPTIIPYGVALPGQLEAQENVTLLAKPFDPAKLHAAIQGTEARLASPANSAKGHRASVIAESR